MNRLFLAWRNIVTNPGRSLALGSFALVSGIIFVFFTALLSTITTNMRAALVNALTGDIQFRSSATEETDMLSLTNLWNGLGKLDASQAKAIADAFRDQPEVQAVRRVRTPAVLRSGKAQEPAMVIGAEPGFTAYQKALTLSEGRHLDPTRDDEIIISKKQAEVLKIGLGDTLEVIAPGDVPRMVKARVVGIGEYPLFDLYGIFFSYTNLSLAQELVGFGPDDTTDIVLFVPSGRDLAPLVEKAARIDPGMKVTTREEQGDFFMGGIELYGSFFYAFLSILLLIIGLMITNMVFSIGLERRREIGTLRAIGFSRASIVALFVGEIGLVGAVFTMIGGAIGAGIVLLLSQVGLEPPPPIVYVMGKPFFMQFSVNAALWPLLAMSAFSALAALFPAVQAASVRPVEVMAEK